MSEVDRSEAKARLDSRVRESKQNNEGAGIPEFVEAVLGDDADEEIAELVLRAHGGFRYHQQRGDSRWHLEAPRVAPPRHDAFPNP
ncbi:MAG: hypothetical protein CM1200mP32_06490 [Methanobacteriota archaeon]|nr:MAG: hypothetical protein CM1200mP32_06490 [Euryarchaeota archaeon]